MKRRQICRLTGHWPDVISDLISAYAELTLEEKLDAALKGAESRDVLFEAPGIVITACITKPIEMVWIGPTRNRRHCHLKTKGELCCSIQSGRWTIWINSVPIEARQLRGLNEWIARYE